MIKVMFGEYLDADNILWQDWSEYLVTPPSISKKVESDRKGEASVIVYDKANITFYFVENNPVYSAFNRDLSGVKRYLMEIYNPDSKGYQKKKFEGIIDFGSIKYPDLSNKIKFDVIDKLSAVAIVSNDIKQRGERKSAWARVPGSYNMENCGVMIKNYNDLWWGDPMNGGVPFYDVVLIATVQGSTGIPHTEPIFKQGETIVIWDVLAQKERMHLVLASGLINVPDFNPTQLATWVKLYPNDVSYLADYYNFTSPKALLYYESTYYSLPAGAIDINGPTDPYGLNPLEAFDALKILHAIISSAWPGVTLINNTGGERYPISLEYYNHLYDYNPLNEQPLEAVKKLASTMRCYIYFNSDGNLVIQSKDQLGSLGKKRTLGNTFKIGGEKTYMWDKLADGITIRVITSIWDSQTNKYFSGEATLLKNPEIQPRNKIEKDVYAPASLNLSTLTREQLFQALNDYALNVAQSDMNFYGNRHSGYSIDLDLDDNINGTETTPGWDVTDNFDLDENYFFDSMELDLEANTVHIDCVSTHSYDYDLRQAVIAKSDKAITSEGGSSVPYSSAGGVGSSLSPLLWDGGPNGLDPSLGRQSLGLSNILSDLAGKEPAILPGTADQYWRGDKTWQNFNTSARAALSAAAPLSFNTGTGIFSLAYTDNLKNTAGQLDTAQGIKTSDTPYWARIGAGGAPDAVLPLKVTGNAKITGHLTVDGDIYYGGYINQVNMTEMNIADKTFALNKGGDNVTAVGGGLVLRGAADSILATILYDGARWAFSKEVKLSGTGIHEIYGDLKQIGNKSVYNNYTSGWAGAGFKLGLDAQGNSFLEIDNINVRKTLSAYGFLLKQISSVNGFEFISSSARVESAWYDGDLGNYYITFEDPTNSNLCPFAVGDMVICQRFKPDGSTVIRRAEATIWEVSGRTCMVVYNYGQAQKGDVLVRIGNEYEPARQNSIYLAADDLNSPFIDIITNVDSWAAWNSAAKTKARFGNLSGITDPLLNPSGYGLYADNVFIKGRLAGSTVSGTTTKTVVMDSSGPVFFASLRNTARSADNLDVYVGSFFGGSHVGILMQAADAAGVNKELFRLSKQISNGAITAKIGPWNFDDSKFANGDVRIEASTAFKGIAVSASGVDIAKFGDFANVSETYGSEDLSFSSNFYSSDAIHFGFNAAGNPTTVFPNEGNGAYYSGARFHIYKDLPISSVKGRNIQITFSIAEFEYIAAEGELVKVFAYVNTDQGDFGLTQVNPSSYTLTGAAKVYSAKSISCIIPSDATYAKLCIRGIRTNYYNTNPPAGIDIKDLTLSRYNKTILEVNKSGFKMFSGPLSRIVMNDQEVSLNVSRLSTNNRLDIGDWTFITETFLDGSNNIISRLRLKYKGQNKGWFNSETGAYSTN